MCQRNCLHNLKKKKKISLVFFFFLSFSKPEEKESTDTHQLKVLKSVTQQEFEIGNRESLDTLALTEGSSGSRRRSIVRVEGKERKNTWRTEGEEEEKSMGMISKAATDSREIARRFITPTLLTPLSPCFPVNARQIHAREHPYTSLRPSATPPPLPHNPSSSSSPPFIYLQPYSSAYEF